MEWEGRPITISPRRVLKKSFFVWDSVNRCSGLFSLFRWGQSYKLYVIVKYDSRVMLGIGNFSVIIYYRGSFIRLATIAYHETSIVIRLVERFRSRGFKSSSENKNRISYFVKSASDHRNRDHLKKIVLDPPQL